LTLEGKEFNSLRFQVATAAVWSAAARGAGEGSGSVLPALELNVLGHIVLLQSAGDLRT
jgi:hypothetical protein